MEEERPVAAERGRPDVVEEERLVAAEGLRPDAARGADSGGSLRSSEPGG